MTPDAPPAPADTPTPESYRTFWDDEPSAPPSSSADPDAYAAFSRLAEV